MAGRLEALFSRCDTSGRGWIELDEFKLICQDMGISKVRRGNTLFIRKIACCEHYEHVVNIIARLTVRCLIKLKDRPDRSGD